MRLQKTRGFTLLEIAVSLAILGIGMVACIQAFGGSLRIKDMVDQHDEAVRLARIKMEELIETGGEGAREEGEYRLSWSSRAANKEQDNVDQIEDFSLELQYLEVVVRWGGGAGTKSYALRTLQTVPRQ